ncbi:MAG: hypothetical protein ACERKD_02870 [Prolixibacteraceae bacterium]
MKLKKLLPILIITAFIIVLLFRNVIFNLNTVYFSDHGDGLKSYYCATYHAVHDSTAGHFEGMNYPWGESVFFTDGQIPITNTVRFIDRHIFPCAHKLVGIINFMLIFSIFLAIIFLYLILKKFNLPDWYALIVAIGISLLSPQLGRINGHFALAWLCWLPIMLYLLILISEGLSWKKSVIFALVTLLSALLHMYFFLFAVALIGIYWIDRIFIHQTWKKQWMELLHPIVQIIIPFIIMELIMADKVVDRTHFPFGLFYYKTFPAAVFLPLYKWYVPFLSQFKFAENYEWESLNYIGFIGTVGFAFLLGQWIIRLKKKRLIKLTFTGNKTLDIFMWSALPLLLLSFGIPFIWGLESLQKHMGIFNQLRGLARFSWLFYYVINIVVWIKLYHFLSTRKRMWTGYLVLSLLLILFLFEGYDSSRSKIEIINNSINALNDTNNETAVNSWVNQIDPQKYQAIMPLPYFHIGSESTWIEPKDDLLKQMFIVSLKTGLPSNGVLLGRTSLSQSYKNIELTFTPWEKFSILDELPSTKPFLVLTDTLCQLNPNEQKILDKADFIMATSHFKFYELQIKDLEEIPNERNYPQKYSHYMDSLQEYFAAGNTTCYIRHTGNFTADETSFTSSSKGSYREYERILEAPVHFDSIQTIYVRFWVKDYNKDMVARTKLLIIHSGMEQQTLIESYSEIFRNIVTLHNDWALIEIPMKLQAPDEIIKVLISNPIINCKQIVFDEFSVSGSSI